jgi:aminoglycoside phosphotransferase (APT) family kinase protein
VLDWELCTLGDPLADLGTLMMYWADGPDDKPPVPGLPEAGNSAPPEAETLTSASVAATALPGFPSRAELASRYAARSGRDLTGLNFYLAFAHWKLACIMEGVYVRYATHAMGGDPADTEVLGAAVAEHAQQAAEALEA